MIKIYEIPSDKLSAVKAILEAPEKETGEIAGVELKIEEGKKAQKLKQQKNGKLMNLNVRDMS